MKYLLEVGSELDFENNWGETRIYLVAKNGFLSVIKVLLNRSETIIPIDKDIKFTLAPIKEAALKGYGHMVEYLLSCSPSPRDYASLSLPFAAISGDTALALLLLRHRADVNYTYIKQHSPREALNLYRGR